MLARPRRKRFLLGRPWGSSVQFVPTLGLEVNCADDGAQKRKKVRYMTSALMNAYQGLSIEEIRFQDYCSGQNRPRIDVPPIDTPHLTTMMKYSDGVTAYDFCNDVKMTRAEKPWSGVNLSCFPLLRTTRVLSSMEVAPEDERHSVISHSFPLLESFGLRGFNGAEISKYSSEECVDVSKDSMWVWDQKNRLERSTMQLYPNSPEKPDSRSLTDYSGSVSCVEPSSLACSMTLPSAGNAPRLFPIFSNGQLVAYTTSELKTNPCSFMSVKTVLSTKDASINTDLPYDPVDLYLEATNSCLYFTSKPGEFIVDDSPRQKQIGAKIMKSYDKVWNHPDEDGSSNSWSGKRHSESYLSAAQNSSQINRNNQDKILNFNHNIHLHCPFIENKLAKQKRRRLLRTSQIFSDLTAHELNYSTVNEKFTLFPKQDENEFVKATGDFCGSGRVAKATWRKGFQVAVDTDMMASMQSSNPTDCRNDEKGSSEKKDSTEDLSMALRKHCWEGLANANATRSRRPRSKSLSVRPRGKSSGVRLTRERYYCIPSVHTLDTMVDEEGRCVIENFQVGHLDYGHMVFEGKMDVAGVNLDEAVVFNLKEMFLYPAPENECSKRIRQLDKPALVTLLQVWPQRVGTNEFIRDVNAINAINYEYLLRKTCERMEVEFISYDPYVGHWQFRLQNRS